MATQQSIVVDVPARIAYDQWTHFEEFPRFMSGVEQVVKTDDVHNHWVTNIGGVRREFDTCITEQIPEQHIAWTTEEGEVRQSGDVTFNPLDDQHTEVTMQLEMEPQGLVEQAAEKLNIVAAQTKADMRRFKEFVEAHDTEAGA